MVAPVGLLAGRVLGRYELLLPVAQGGMGTVWAARARGGSIKGGRGSASIDSQIVAVKTMLPALSSDPRFERMFLAESRIASRIHHPNVCAILDQGEQGGVLYFVMEWVDGDSVVALIGGSSTRKDAKALPYSVAVRIGIEAALGLHAAHELRDESGALIGIVHRDVSPHNILVTRHGQVKIADFGVAKAMAQTETPTTSTGHMKGKIHFMAPEQVVGDALDRRTDIFALGIVLYQLTTGTHPFSAAHELATMARITRPEPVDRPSSLVPGYPPDLEAAVMRALAKDPGKRFASMAELAAALEAVEAGLGTPRDEVAAFVQTALADRTAKRVGLIQEALRAVSDESSAAHLLPAQPLPSDPRRRGRTIMTGAALVAGGAILGAASLIWLGARPEPPAPAAPPEQAPLEPSPAPTAVTVSDLDLPPTTSSGSASVSASGSSSAPSSAPSSSSAPATPAAIRREPGKAKFRHPGF